MERIIRIIIRIIFSFKELNIYVFLYEITDIQVTLEKFPPVCN